MNNFKKNQQEEDTSTNDTNSEEDTSEESTDSKDTSSSDTDTSEDTEDSDDSEDITKQYFTNPDSLDPKLRGAFKKMQGIFTKRMQEATLGVKKAQAFDTLILDPEFRAWMEERNNRATGNVSSKKSSKRTDDSEDDSDDTEDDDTPMTRKALRAEFQNIFKSMAQEGNQRQQEQAMREEAAQFKRDNPDWEIYKEPMMAIIEKHPTLGYQEAYDLAVREDNKKSSKKDTLETKKRANINKPNKVTGKTVEKKGKMKISEAFAMAKRSLGM